MAAAYSYDVEAPAGKLGVAAGSGATLDNTNLLKITSSRGGGGVVEPASIKRKGLALNVVNNGVGVESKGRHPGVGVRAERDGREEGKRVIHQDRGELQRRTGNILKKGDGYQKGDVLVVDDTSTVRSLLKRAVTRLGQGVDTACTGQVGGSPGGAKIHPHVGGRVASYRLLEVEEGRVFIFGPKRPPVAAVAAVVLFRWCPFSIWRDFAPRGCSPFCKRATAANALFV